MGVVLPSSGYTGCRVRPSKSNHVVARPSARVNKVTVRLSETETQGQQGFCSLDTEEIRHRLVSALQSLSWPLELRSKIVLDLAAIAFDRRSHALVVQKGVRIWYETLVGSAGTSPCGPAEREICHGKYLAWKIRRRRATRLIQTLTATG